MTDTSTLLRHGPAAPVNRNWLILALLIVGMAVALLASFSSSPPTPPQPAAPSQALPRAAEPVAEPVAQVVPAPAPAAVSPAMVVRPRPLVQSVPARRPRPARTARSVRPPAPSALARGADPIGDLLDDAAAAGMTTRQPVDDSAGTPR